METDNKKTAAPHSLCIDERKRIKVNGVESVTSFSPGQIVLTLASGKLTVGGEDLKITGFSKETGVFLAEGKVKQVKYGAGLVDVFK